MFFWEWLDWSTFKCKLIHLGSKLKRRTDRYDFSRKIRTLELPCKTQLRWCNILESGWTVSAPSVGSQSNHFILSFSIFGYLTCKASSNFHLVGSQFFHMRQQEPGSIQNFEGQLGKACMSGKLYPLGCVISSSDAMIAPPGPWNLPLWPGLLIRTSTCFLPHLKLFCVRSFCHVDSHSLDFFAYYLPKFSVFIYTCCEKLWVALSLNRVVNCTFNF